MRRRWSPFLLFTIFIILTLPVPSCSAASPRTSLAWTASDLRLLDPAGDADTAAADILAVYARITSQDVQFRVDLLDLTLESEYQLLLLVYEGENPQPMRVTVTRDEVGFLPTNGHAPVQPRVVRDPWLDAITISFNRHLLARQISFSAATFLPSGLEPPQDSTVLLHLDAPAPSNRASVLIVFTDSFPAATPAQALRRWDGAHTGPTGERHGLKHVLAAASASGIPITLADLKIPASLAALDFLGITGDLRRMAKDGLLILPDVAYAEPAGRSLDSSRLAAQAFGLPASPFDYSATSGILPGAGSQFVSLPDPTRLSHSAGTRLIPLPAPGVTPQATEDGPSLAVRRALVAAALADDASLLVTLGGSLPESTWGDSDMAAPTFAWLAAHPWIHVLDGGELQRFPVGAADLPLVSPAVGSDFLSSLEAAPDNAITASAWQTWFMLTAPATNADLQQLRLNYLGQVGILVAASTWADRPYDLYACGGDPDRDLRPECILANAKYFAVIETGGARLTHLFYGEHQLVGPTAQFVVGLSDPSQWNNSPGDAADPGQVMGAFFDTTQPFMEYTVAWPAVDTLVLASADGSRVKTFLLTEYGLEGLVQSRDPTGMRIPLAVDPQGFYAGPVEYRASLSPDSWQWGPAGGTRVRVRTDAAFLAQGFTISLPFLGLPENPDLDYPAGHYFPFPLSIVDMQGHGTITVQIGIP